MTPAELQKLRPEADTVAAINEALGRVAEARTVAEGAQKGAHDAKAELLAQGADAKARKAAAEALEAADFDLAQLDKLGAELSAQMAAARERQAAQARQGEIAQLEAAVEAHGRAWSKDLPKHVAAIEALLRERGYLCQRAAELGRGDLVTGWAGDLRPPLEQALNPASGWLFPSTLEMQAAAADTRTAQAKTIRQAELVAEGNHRLTLRGYATWPKDGPKVATIVVGELGRSYSVYGRSIAGGVPVEMDWPEAVRICDVALVPATLRHPTAGPLQFPGRGNQGTEQAA